MKGIVFFLVASLALAGCAGKKAMNEQAPLEAAPDTAVQESAAPPQTSAPDPVEAVISEAQEVKVERPADRIFFDFDSYLLTPEGMNVLADNAEWLQDQADIRILIEGLTDERGSDTYNLALGEKRAQAAREYLLNLGIAPERIATISYGEEKASQGADDSAWKKDRRAEFVIAN